MGGWGKIDREGEGGRVEAMAAIDWTHIYKKHKGQWVALKEDEQTVIASGKTATEAWDKAQETGYTQPILTRMPETLVLHI